MEQLPAPPAAKPTGIAKRAVDLTDDPIITRALALRFGEGLSWRACAKALDMDKGDLYKRVRPFELLLSNDESYENLKKMTMALAMEAVTQVTEDLADGKIKAGTKPILMGITIDKVARMMNAEKAPVQPSNPMLDALARIHASGGSIKLEVTQPRTIEATIVSTSNEGNS